MTLKLLVLNDNNYSIQIAGALCVAAEPLGRMYLCLLGCFVLLECSACCNSIRSKHRLWTRCGEMIRQVFIVNIRI
jgi:hypothetical protein